ncbi:MAG TPA: hypothetical protein VMQ60_01540 [Acidobacteriaceae bacterium]|jgi:hypothetical protein|nr:hypothetical protein [Acidobacteriaceae bacterium]
MWDQHPSPPAWRCCGIIAGLDGEIARLRQVRALLTGSNGHIATKRGPRKKHVMSAEARKRIGDAQRKRWAKWKRIVKK